MCVAATANAASRATGFPVFIYTSIVSKKRLRIEILQMSIIENMQFQHCIDYLRIALDLSLSNMK
jgi:hypothetical protein